MSSPASDNRVSHPCNGRVKGNVDVWLSVVTAWYLTGLLVALGFSFGFYLVRPPSSGLAEHRGVFEAFTWMDGKWYRQIASEGYHYDPDARSNVAFYPVYPLLGRAVMALSGLRAEAARKTSAAGAAIQPPEQRSVSVGRLDGKSAAVDKKRNQRFKAILPARTKAGRKNNLTKLVLLDGAESAIVSACRMQKRSKGFVRSFVRWRRSWPSECVDNGQRLKRQRWAGAECRRSLRPRASRLTRLRWACENSLIALRIRESPLATEFVVAVADASELHKPTHNCSRRLKCWSIR